ncbi:MAG: helix-turn-helix transcriptional regulator, partial [Raoultibacter sp.]
ATLSYTAFSILIMIVLSNMVYRYGMNALWLFGIERAVRQLFMFGGREAESLVERMTPVFPQGEVLINVVIVLLVIATTMILLSEKDLMSRWGIGKQKPLRGNSPDGGSAPDHPALGSVCADMAKHYALSMRESEVLLLLAQKKSIAEIEKDLFIANGTAKAHVRHIYQKLDIHSREELFDLVEKTKEGSA